MACGIGGGVRAAVRRGPLRAGPVPVTKPPRPIRIVRRDLRLLLALGAPDVAQAAAMLVAARRRFAAHAHRGARLHA